MVKEFQVELLIYYARLDQTYKLMPERERDELHAWEAENVDGSTVGSSDWPGWAERYGLSRPVPVPRPRTAAAPRTEKESIPERLRWAVWERDNFTCQECGLRRDLSADHIIPESAGGLATLDNLQTLCRSCNSRKGTKMPPGV